MQASWHADNKENSRRSKPASDRPPSASQASPAQQSAPPVPSSSHAHANHAPSTPSTDAAQPRSSSPAPENNNPADQTNMASQSNTAAQAALASRSKQAVQERRHVKAIRGRSQQHAPAAPTAAAPHVATCQGKGCTRTVPLGVHHCGQLSCRITYKARRSSTRAGCSAEPQGWAWHSAVPSSCAASSRKRPAGACEEAAGADACKRARMEANQAAVPSATGLPFAGLQAQVAPTSSGADAHTGEQQLWAESQEMGSTQQHAQHGAMRQKAKRSHEESVRGQWRTRAHDSAHEQQVESQDVSKRHRSAELRSEA